MNNLNSGNRNTEIRSKKISDTTKKSNRQRQTATIDPNFLRTIKNNSPRPSSSNTSQQRDREFSLNTVGYIDPEEFEKKYSKEFGYQDSQNEYAYEHNNSTNRNINADGATERRHDRRTRGEPLKNPVTGETMSTGRTSTRSGKGTGTLNDSNLGKWLIAGITAVIIIGMAFFYIQNDGTRNALVDSLTGNTTNPNAGETTHDIGDNENAPKGPSNNSDDFENANNMNGNGDNIINDGTADNANANIANGDNIISANASGTVGSSRSGYYDEYGNYVTNDTLHSGDGRAFDADSLAERIAASLSSDNSGTANSGTSSSGASNNSSGGNASVSSGDPADILNSADYTYVISEHDGRLAIFLDGNSEPLEVYDTYVADLPEADRRYIRDGIRTTSVAELAAYLEDLTS